MATSSPSHIFRRWDDGFVVRQMTHDDIKTVERWYSGICPTSVDLSIAYQVSSESGFANGRFLIGDLNGETVASKVETNVGGPVSYGSLFYVEEKYRKFGFGRRINDTAGELSDQLKFVVGIDAHDELEGMNHRRGYLTAFKITQFQGKVGKPSEAVAIRNNNNVHEITDSLFDAVVSYDNQCFVVSDSHWRRNLLSRWFKVHGGRSVAMVTGTDGQTVVGFGSRRPALCHPGNHIIGPLYADNLDIARDLVTALTQDIVGQTIWINICELNTDAVTLVKELQLTDSLHMLRMYRNTKEHADDITKLRLQPSSKVLAITSIDVCGY